MDYENWMSKSRFLFEQKITPMNVKFEDAQVGDFVLLNKDSEFIRGGRLNTVKPYKVITPAHYGLFMRVSLEGCTPWSVARADIIKIYRVIPVSLNRKLLL